LSYQFVQVLEEGGFNIGDHLEIEIPREDLVDDNHLYIALGAAGGVLLLLMMLCGTWCYFRKKRDDLQRVFTLTK
jgi:hypothetical protein